VTNPNTAVLLASPIVQGVAQDLNTTYKVTIEKYPDD